MNVGNLGDGDPLASRLIDTLLSSVPDVSPDELEKFLSAEIPITFSIMELASISALTMTAERFGGTSPMISETAKAIRDKIGVAVDDSMDGLRREILGE